MEFLFNELLHKETTNPAYKYLLKCDYQNSVLKPLQDIVEVFNNDLSEFAKYNAILAGGSIVNTLLDIEITDYDFFCSFWTFEDFLEYTKFKEIELGDCLKLINVSRAGLVRTYNYQDKKIQLIYPGSNFKTGRLLNSFDLNVCRFAMTPHHLFFSNTALSDLRDKKITLNTISRPLSTIQRVFKYKQKGFTISHDFGYSILSDSINKIESQVKDSKYYNEHERNLFDEY